MIKNSTTTRSGSRTIRNRSTRTDAIADAMHDRYRAVSIDTLLTRPSDAIRMAADAAHRAGELSGPIARKLSLGCDYIDALSANAVITEMLRTAMADRKKGGSPKPDKV